MTKPSHFNGPQKSCFDYGCTDDCPVRAYTRIPEDQVSHGRNHGGSHSKHGAIAAALAILLALLWGLVSGSFRRDKAP